ncbi:hypothetical protein [Kineococcus sp. SYSU DK002]|uniref:hypothetical protein n=1 Tax=Kineococcus sp. SYSU DK002 TaxID=3383123 RepID=UPI003D7EF8B1
MNSSGAGKKVVDAAVTAGRALLRRGDPPGAQRQTLTVARPVGTVLRACQDPQVLATLLGDAGSVREAGPGRLEWDVAGWTGTTQVHAEPNRVVFATDGEGPAEPLVVEAWPAPRWDGCEVVVRLAVPATPDLLDGALAFTMAYRLRALLQTGEVPTLAENPSGRAGVGR